MTPPSEHLMYPMTFEKNEWYEEKIERALFSWLKVFRSLHWFTLLYMKYIKLV